MRGGAVNTGCRRVQLRNVRSARVDRAGQSAVHRQGQGLFVGNGFLPFLDEAVDDFRLGFFERAEILSQSLDLELDRDGRCGCRHGGWREAVGEAAAIAAAALAVMMVTVARPVRCFRR